MSCISCILFTNALVLQMHACSDNKHDSRPKQMQLGGNSRRMWFFARIWLMNGMECLVAEHNKSRCRKPQRRDAHALAVKQRHQNNTHIPCVYIYIYTHNYTHSQAKHLMFLQAEVSTLVRLRVSSVLKGQQQRTDCPRTSLRGDFGVWMVPKTC